MLNQIRNYYLNILSINKLFNIYIKIMDIIEVWSFKKWLLSIMFYII